MDGTADGADPRARACNTVMDEFAEDLPESQLPAADVAAPVPVAT
ncbi:hypothetical protein [Mycolicibacterium fortuitum]|uniref:Uncharacterized protein n=1 Tax=Mycolicibacterium fortuitum TaxID=1766 RepID=A0AAE4VEZ3_MYCFO|nr:hypothetical protein [Mycolicibacterium fortuitum]MDV7193177.1 hypothetical protein [Mycolicibacterium fortuitum]MDV7206482.1 hypothetical protein [Mycolicibacterium fortuitum]MDV7260345.1 hypothetical protein [Mycolicibacterium fortuitum]MDV7285053.1 hypothetical protein [Mycolicibacterium fortuitum]MDV7292990.1 hypothetical protein [Mycolicibacterium fortuitum]